MTASLGIRLGNGKGIADGPSRTDWQLPEGVPRGVWDYAQSVSIAEDYDDYFGTHPLFSIDQEILSEALGDVRGKVVVDLGCGTGRALGPLVDRGAVGVAVDLSHSMLCEVSKKMVASCVQANLVDLRCFADQQFDHALCLFSTLGMIRGRSQRQRTLTHVSRMLKADGTLVLHVHNAWRNLLDAGRLEWLWQTVHHRLARSEFEIGDKFFPYRGVPNFFLHTFWPSEIRTDISSAALRITREYALDPSASKILPQPASNLRAGGWVFICQRESQIG